jgi:hypothetical protein
MRTRLFLAGILCTLLAARVQAQTTPTGILTGQVVDSSGAVMPGVSVTAASPSLQGTRSAVTSANGDYIIPFLPAGDYAVSFELAGFQKQTKRIRVQVAETVPLHAQLSLSAVTEELTVTAEPPTDFTASATAASSYKAEMIDRLPEAHLTGRYSTPGTNDNGPGSIHVSGPCPTKGSVPDQRRRLERDAAQPVNAAVHRGRGRGDQTSTARSRPSSGASRAASPT